MNRLLRTLPPRRLLLLCACAVVLPAGGAAIAIAASAGGPVPAPKQLAQAVHDALAAPPVEGVTARISFKNRLISGADIEGGNALLGGANGRLWLSRDGRARLELQASAGDVQVVYDGGTVSVYDASSNTAYRGRVPQGKTPDRGGAEKHEKVPTVTSIQDALSRFARHADVSGAIPGDVAGRPAYTVRVAPRRGGGLVGAVELAWDAVRGAPLRAAIYARGDSSPVLELAVTDISYGPVPASVFAVTPPAGAKVVDLSPKDRAGSPGGKRAHVTGLEAVQAALPFKLSAPDSLTGMPRDQVTLVGGDREPDALVTYGKGLGGLAVLERAAKPGEGAAAGSGGDHRGLMLPSVTVGGERGTELKTALGTVVTFDRGGVSYTVLGSVPSATAESAARGL